MRIVRDFHELTTPPPHAVVTIGNFDGVHLGHREIFRRVVARARSVQGTAVVLTFVPHPLKLLAPERAPRLINTDAEKARLIAASCIDLLVSVPFTHDLAACSAEDFVRDYLVSRLGVRHLIVGYDYAFGRGREGDGAFLRRQGEQYGFTVEILAPIVGKSEVFSSTRVRELLLQGEMEEVVGLLGRHFTLEGRVGRGAGRGRSLGFPTANLQTEKEILPRPGVYAVKVKRGEMIYDGVLNIGSNPTFGGHGMTVEVHLLDFSGDLYEEQLRLYFVRRLRDEERFASVPALCAAIAADIAAARQLLATTRIIEYREYLDCGDAAESGDCR